jgi:hypothetical protein
MGEVVGDGQEYLALMIGSEGKGPMREKAAVLLAPPLLLAG